MHDFVSFRADLGYVLAVDAGADNTVAKLADLSGAVLASARVPHSGTGQTVTQCSRRSETSVDQVLAGLGRAAQRSAGDRHRHSGCCRSATGRITLAPQIVDWDGIDLASELSDIAECPIVVENEAHLSLLAEQWLGAARSHRNVVYIQLGIGIGAAILIDGRLYRGSSGAAGEIAYLVTDGGDADQPRDSAVGPFEWFAGGDAYRRRGAIAAMSERGALLLSLAGGDPEAVTAQIVFDAAAAGDPAALDVATAVLELLGRGVANIASILNPDLILLGGGIANAGATVLGPIREAVGRLLTAPARRGTERPGRRRDGARGHPARHRRRRRSNLLLHRHNRLAQVRNHRS